jgi:hypothetical protein
MSKEELMMSNLVDFRQKLFNRNSITFNLKRRKKMKGKIVLTFVILAVLTAGCATGKEVRLTDFDKVKVQDGFHVDITVGEEYSVTLKVDDDVLEKVEAVKQGDTLIIRAKPFQGVISATLAAEVTMPALTALSLGSGSHVNVKGSGDELTLKASAGSHADLSDFKVENAVVKASSASHVTVNVSGKLDASASSGSHIFYLGDPYIRDSGVSSGSMLQKKQW